MEFRLQMSQYEYLEGIKSNISMMIKAANLNTKFTLKSVIVWDVTKSPHSSFHRD